MAKYMVYGNGKIGKIYNYNSKLLAFRKAKSLSIKKENNFQGVVQEYRSQKASKIFHKGK